MTNTNPPNNPSSDAITEPLMTNVHQCLAEASASSRDDQGPMVGFSVRLPKGLKKLCMFICERNATDLGTYLRQCAKALARDYEMNLPDSE